VEAEAKAMLPAVVFALNVMFVFVVVDALPMVAVKAKLLLKLAGVLQLLEVSQSEPLAPEAPCQVAAAANAVSFPINDPNPAMNAATHRTFRIRIMNGYFMWVP
jgi:hypothetical protein